MSACWIGADGNRAAESQPGFDAIAHLEAFDLEPTRWLPLVERMAEQSRRTLRDALYAVTGAIGFASLEQRAALTEFGVDIERLLYKSLTDRYPVEV